MHLGLVVGLDQEAAIVSKWGRVAIGGGTYAGALKAAEVLVELGVDALISFGVAGGLDPDLKPGTLLAAAEVLIDDKVLRATLIPPGVRQARMLGAKTVATTIAEKALLWSETRAACVDLESGAVALVAQRHRLPFGALRAICDPASRALPPAATDALVDGSIRIGRVLLSLLRDPGQLPALFRLAGDARLARLALQSLRLEGLGG
jgi:adenosylhomocysteine nucleosidase